MKHVAVAVVLALVASNAHAAEPVVNIATRGTSARACTEALLPSDEGGVSVGAETPKSLGAREEQRQKAAADLSLAAEMFRLRWEMLGTWRRARTPEKVLAEAFADPSLSTVRNSHATSMAVLQLYLSGGVAAGEDLLNVPPVVVYRVSEAFLESQSATAARESLAPTSFLAQQLELRRQVRELRNRLVASNLGILSMWRKRLKVALLADANYATTRAETGEDDDIEQEIALTFLDALECWNFSKTRLVAHMHKRLERRESVILKRTPRAPRVELSGQSAWMPEMPIDQNGFRYSSGRYAPVAELAAQPSDDREPQYFDSGADLIRMLGRLPATMTPRDRQIFETYLGLLERPADFEHHAIDASTVGIQFDITARRVSQIVAQAARFIGVEEGLLLLPTYTKRPKRAP